MQVFINVDFFCKTGQISALGRWQNRVLEKCYDSQCVVEKEITVVNLGEGGGMGIL